VTLELTAAQLASLTNLVRDAGEDILKIYQHPESTELVSKVDASPLTAADLAAHKRLANGLSDILDLPILSEESSPDDYQNRLEWRSFWLIDPLDGTKEFLARNGQFTVNVALIHDGIAVQGMVYQPVTRICYWGHIQTGAWRQIDKQPAQAIHCRSIDERYRKALPLHALVSQHHHSKQSQTQLDNIQQHWPAKIDVVPLGSSLKLCAIAEGSADLYLRLGPTNEWDTAAAQAVLEAAGGQLVAAASPHQRFTYNRRNTLLNNDFCACSNPQLILDWVNLH